MKKEILDLFLLLLHPGHCNKMSKEHNLQSFFFKLNKTYYYTNTYFHVFI